MALPELHYDDFAGTWDTNGRARWGVTEWQARLASRMRKPWTFCDSTADRSTAAFATMRPSSRSPARAGAVEIAAGTCRSGWRRRADRRRLWRPTSATKRVRRKSRSPTVAEGALPRGGRRSQSAGGKECGRQFNRAVLDMAKPAADRSEGPRWNAGSFSGGSAIELIHTALKSILKVVPLPGSLSTAIFPLWSATTDCTIASPRPVPCAFVV